MADSAAIDTSKVSQRRALHFNAMDDALADVDALEAAERDGKLVCHGNWTFGQTLGHLATWVDYSFDGLPLKVPFLVRWILRPMKHRTLYKPMRPGSKIPRVAGGTLATEPYSSDEGLFRFRRSFTRLKNECPALPHVLFGPLTHEEWINQHLRHAELHLSFLRPE